MFIILDDASNYSEQSEQSQKKVNGNDGITHSKKYKKKESKVGSKYSKNNKIYNSLSSEINNSVSIRSSNSNGLDDDKKNNTHSDIGVIIGNISIRIYSIHYTEKKKIKAD